MWEYVKLVALWVGCIIISLFYLALFYYFIKGMVEIVKDKINEIRKSRKRNRTKNNSK